MTSFIIWIVLFAAIPLISASGETIAIIPQPQQLKLQSSRFDLTPGEIGWQLAGTDSGTCAILLGDLNEIIESIPGIQRVRKKSSRQIWLGLPANDAEFAKICQQKKLWPLPDSGAETYGLHIEKNLILLVANHPRGLFYAVQTLKQIFRGRPNLLALPGIKIVDWPILSLRGIQDDISRGPVPTLSFFKKQIRRCAELKFNFISYYTEHVIATEKYVDFAPAGGALSLAEWRELADFAEKHFVELVPNFQSFGHFEKILAHPQYAPLGEANRLLSPALPESYDLLFSIFSEMAPVFQSSFFNINCDETWDLGRGPSKKMVDSLGVAEIYTRHILKLHSKLQSLGKQMWMWGDIAQAHPEILAELPKDIIMLPWNYSALDSFQFMTRPFRQAGFDFIVCPGILNSRRIAPDFKMARQNIRAFIAAGVADSALGVMTTIWDDGGSALFSRDWYGIAFAADQSWHPETEADFDFRFDAAVYGDLAHGISQSLRILEKLTDLAATQEMNEKIFWNAVVPQWDERLLLDFSDWPEILAVCDSAARALDLATPRFAADDLDFLQLTLAQYRFLGFSRQWLLEAANLYRQACLVQKNSRSAAREAVADAIERVSRTRQLLVELKIDFQTCWLKENRVYWLQNLMNRYDQRIADFSDVESRLLQALADFEKGHFLPPPTEVRLAISEQMGQYFQSWLLVGPFPNPTSDYIPRDYLTPLGGETRARGKVALQFDLPGVGTFRWQKYASPEPGIVNLKKIYEKNDKVVAYAYCRIESPRSQNVRATFGSNDGIEVICNGQNIFQRHLKRNLQPDEDEVWLPLQAGQNHLLLKIDQGKGDWGFSFRLPDVVLRNHDYKYRILE